MRSARAFTLIDAGVIAASGLALAALADITAFTPRPQLIAQSLNNLRAIGMANAQYRADNAGYFPIELTNNPRRLSPPTGGVGWCGWSFAGKNNAGWWQSTSGSTRFFDVEAADRPLNSYLYPEMVFHAPTPPAQLPADSEFRLTEQAPLNRDPADSWSNQRSWPNTTKGISMYDDVGTSYLWNSSWWPQFFSTPDWTVRMRTATQRLAVGTGITPSRFVWCQDPFVDIATFSSSTMAMVRNWYGEFNKSVMLFYDGHADYLPTFPGRKQRSYSNEYYSLIFEDLPNPGTP